MDKSKYNYIVFRVWEQFEDDEEGEVMEDYFDMSTTKGQDDLKYYLPALKDDGFSLLDTEEEVDGWDDVSIYLTVYATNNGDASNIDDGTYNKLIEGVANEEERQAR